ncbi:unnamed protein product [Adineta steineri]|uniref:Uncharacterized protein n=1 Tax=Adineta steineri TaxID=433720 RepID=A0A815S3N2_9BILA|nr:unnamed protein product [Adineta steineri]CAF1484984.1 unnamed protein product [Adineta steineri]CAF1493541.1 unnamed protein product [Adineta steineri]CAF3657088.1 unnamed protein product [Adineta steineri]CAF3885611.1 unnamed protein product [Adineta steineri]
MSSATLTDDDRRLRVTETIKLLSMERCASTAILKLSGGERKRLAFATVILTDPSVMLIDEPTSNLDSYLAKSIMQTIHKLAVEQKRSIVVVLHQPTTDMFQYIDSLCVLAANGRQAFFGGARIEALRFFTSECGLPAASLDEIIEQVSSDSSVSQQVADQFSAKSIASHIPSKESIRNTSLESATFVTASFWRQLKWLLWYSSMAGARSPLRTTKLAFRLLIMGVIFGVAYFQLDPLEPHYVQNLNVVPFVIGMALVVSNMTIAAVNILTERRLLVHDIQRRIYSVEAYYVAKFIIDSIFIIIMSILYAIITVLLVDMKEYWMMMLVISMETLAGCAFASLVASASSSILITLLVLQSSNIILNQFTGVLINLKSIPYLFKWLQYLSHYYYGYASMLILQWRYVITAQEPCPTIGTHINDTISTASPICYRSGTAILKEYGIHKDDLNFNLFMLLVLILGYHIASFTITLIRIRRTLS